MIIKIGHLWQNSTLRFLAPGLRTYDSVFNLKINQLQLLAMGIFDQQLSGNPFFVNKPYLYIVYDEAFNPRQTRGIIDWLKYQPYYVENYSYDTSRTVNRFKVIVIEYPLKETYNHFLNSKYSLMYTKEQIDKFFTGIQHNYARSVFFKSSEMKSKHKSLIKDLYGVELTEEDMNQVGYEVEMPFTPDKEILNFV